MRGNRVVFKVKQAERQINKTFRLPETLFNQLELISKENNISMNNLLCQCAEYALANMEPVKTKGRDINDTN